MLLRFDRERLYFEEGYEAGGGGRLEPLVLGDFVALDVADPLVLHFLEQLVAKLGGVFGPTGGYFVSGHDYVLGGLGQLLGDEVVGHHPDAVVRGHGAHLLALPELGRVVGGVAQMGGQQNHRAQGHQVGQRQHLQLVPPAEQAVRRQVRQRHACPVHLLGQLGQAQDYRAGSRLGQLRSQLHSPPQVAGVNPIEHHVQALPVLERPTQLRHAGVPESQEKIVLLQVELHFLRSCQRVFRGAPHQVRSSIQGHLRKLEEGSSKEFME